MEIGARLPWTELGIGGLTQAHVTGALPESLQAPGVHAISRSRPALDPALLEEFLSEAQHAGTNAWERLRDPAARVVVAGQQPGCLGGPLLVWYKAATAVALARRIERDGAGPVVPLFWNATDDVDFEEIARVGWPDAAGALGLLEMPRAARRSQAFVGALPAAGDEQAAVAAMELLDGATRAHVQGTLPHAASDHGVWVGELLAHLFPDLAVLDARSHALRRHAAALFARYLKQPEALSSHVRAAGAQLENAGFPPTLSAASARMALFLVRDGQRVKADGDSDVLRQALATQPENLAPNVMLRPLVQDLLLPVIAHVIGPSELGYLLELREVRRSLDVPEPALIPRLSMTTFDSSAWHSAERLGLEASDVVNADEAGWRRAARARVATPLESLRAAFADLDAALDGLGDEAPYASRVARSRRRAEGLRDELARHIEDAALGDLHAAQPELGSLRTLARPRGRAQERVVAALWLQSRWGEETAERLLRLADAHLDALEQGVVEHFVVLD